MAFFKKIYQKSTDKWYPRSITQGKTSTDTIAQYISEGTTLSLADVRAVLTALPSAMKHYMTLGNTVKLDYIGTFYYTAKAAGQGVDTESEVSKTQIKGVHVRFNPASTRRADNTYSRRYLVDDDIEWTEI